MFTKLSMLFMVIINIYTISFSQVPSGYTVTYSKDFQTSLQNAGDYLANDVWYYYSNPNPSYSVSNNKDPGIQKRFIITSDPTNANNRVLKIIKFAEDIDYRDPNLNPRSELSGQPTLRASAANEYYFHLKTYFPSVQKDVSVVAFTQFWLHSPSFTIPIQIMVMGGYFNVNDPRNAGSKRLSNNAKLSDNLNRWITWEVRAKFNRNNGYFDLYMDGQKVFTWTHPSIQLWPKDNETWHPQFGIYGPKGYQEVYFDDLIIARKTGTSTSVNKLPTINFTAPLNNKQFTAPAQVQLAASASDSDGTISKVEFFKGTTLLGTSTTSPYSMAWNNVPAGSYVITAKATDNKGAVSPNASVSFSVVNPILDCSGAIKVRSNGDDGNVAANTIDNNLGTRWSSSLPDAYLMYSLPCPVSFSQVGIAFYKGNERKTFFDILVSSDSLKWNTIYTGQSSGSSLATEFFKVSPVSNVRYIKLNGHGNTISEWTSITEVTFKYCLNCVTVVGPTVVQTENREDNLKNESEILISNGISKSVTLSLNRPSMVNIKIFALNGTVAGTVVNKVFSEGSHQFLLDILNLPRGAYLCRIQIANDKSKIFKVSFN
jgi:hypothetical protein